MISRKQGYQLYLFLLALTVSIITVWLALEGYDYYHTPIEERFYHEHHDWFKASGIFGHGLGIIGTLLITIGVFLYIPAKKYGFLEKYIRLKYLLDFHIFLCTLGPILILFHTTFKFGGIVSVAFWSMVLVVLSGVIGRYIYLQLPRSISGREMSRQEIKQAQEAAFAEMAFLTDQKPELLNAIKSYENPHKSWWGRRKHFISTLKSYRAEMAELDISDTQRKKVMATLRSELKLQQRINNLETMQRLFKYWHVAHRPFALIMLFVVIAHIAVTWIMGYTWIF